MKSYVHNTQKFQKPEKWFETKTTVPAEMLKDMEKYLEDHQKEQSTERSGTLQMLSRNVNTQTEKFHIPKKALVEDEQFVEWYRVKRYFKESD